MAFPSSPTNGQVATIGGITYTYNSTKTAWVRTPSVGSNISVFSTVITGTTASSSTTTGALQVAGGVGIQGSLYTSSLVVNGISINNDGFPSGTVMLFVQTTAPTGWTKSTAHDNKALRVVSGTASSGGSTAFTSVFTSRTPAGTVGDTTLTAAQSGLPAHSHTINDPGHTHTQTTSATDGASGRADASSGGTIYNNVNNINSSTTGITINNNTATNASQSHTHGFTGTALDFAVQYVDVIIATKN